MSPYMNLFRLNPINSNLFQLNPINSNSTKPYKFQLVSTKVTKPYKFQLVLNKPYKFQLVSSKPYKFQLNNSLQRWREIMEKADVIFSKKQQFIAKMKGNNGKGWCYFQQK